MKEPYINTLFPDLEELKEAQSAMVNNWQLIVETLRLCDVHINDDMKKLISIGDSKVLKELLEVIKQKDEELSGLIKDSTTETERKGTYNCNKIVKAAVDIESLDVRKNAEEMENSLEFLLIGMCKAFNIKPKQVIKRIKDIGCRSFNRI